MKTRDINGVEILAVGTWNGDQYTRADLESMVEAFPVIGIDPPVKLGHNSNQKMLKEAGLPAAGYVKALRLQGDKLVADLRDVPQKIADLIKVKAYSKVSSEVWFDVKYKGQKFAKALKAIALLGAEVPAVNTIADIEALYGADLPTLQATYSTEPGNEDRDEPRTAEYADDATSEMEDLMAMMREWLDKVEARTKGKKGVRSMRVMMREALNMVERQLSREDGDMNRAELTKSLGLSENASDDEISSAISELNKKAKAHDDAADKAKADAEAAKTAENSKKDDAGDDEVRQLRTKVLELEQNQAKAVATAAVEDAIREGKILPAQRETSMNYALNDLEGFKAFVKTAPVIVKTSQLSQSSEAKTSEGDAELTEAEKSVAKMLGMKEEDVLNSKKAYATA